MKKILSLGLKVPDHIQKTLQIYVSPDKSITHRALILGSLARGESTVSHALYAGDTYATIKALRQLGVKISVKKKADNQKGSREIKISSPGFSHFRNGKLEFNFLNSGTTARMLQPLLASIPGLTAYCSGDASLSQRSMTGVFEVIEGFGGEITSQGIEKKLPLYLQGKAMTQPSGIFKLKSPSAQVKSAALLLALTLMTENKENNKGKFVLSTPAKSRDHTEHLMHYMGQKVTSIAQENGGEVIHLHSSGKMLPLNLKVPGDPSSAAFFTLLPIVKPNLAVYFPELLLNPRRLGYFSKLVESGMRVEFIPSKKDKQYSEKTGGILVYRKNPKVPLKAFRITSEEVPSLIDEIPLLAVLSAFAQGSSAFYSLGPLRGKESDRLALSARLAEILGCKVKIAYGDDLHIQPKAHLQDTGYFLGFEDFDAQGDHRIEMIIAMLKLCLIQGLSRTGPVAKISFPNFYEILGQINKIILGS